MNINYMTTIKHILPRGGEHRLQLEFAKYANGQTAIRAYDASDGMPFMTITVCIEDGLLKEDEVAIKDYSENEGILNTLLQYEIVDFPHAFIQSDFVKIPICKLLIKTV
jgi:hypothetical protein